MRHAFLIAALAALTTISPASATIRIAGDAGGLIGAYVQRHEAMRQSGERVVIDGPCLSACTMVLGVIPRDRICVTSRALLGFHAAYDLDQSGRRVTNLAGSSLMMDHYPPQVRNWIARRGGLSRQMVFLSGRGLSSMYAPCGALAGDDRAGAAASRAAVGAAPGFVQSSGRERMGGAATKAPSRSVGQQQTRRSGGRGTRIRACKPRVFAIASSISAPPRRGIADVPRGPLMEWSGRAPAQDRAVSCRHLSRNEPQPGGEVAAFGERIPHTDRGDHCTGR